MTWPGSNRERDRRAIDAARAAVQRVAADEMPLFEDTARAWQKLRGRRRDRTDEMLGFGVGELAPVITTAALAAAYAAAGFIARTALDEVRDETSTAIRSRTQRFIKRALLAGHRRPPEPPPAEAREVSHPNPAVEAVLLPADLARVRAATLSVLYSAGLPAQQSALLADAVVGALVTGTER